MPEDLRHHDSDSDERSKHESSDDADGSKGKAEDGMMNAQRQPGISYADVAAPGPTPHSEHTEDTELHEVRPRNGNGRPSDTDTNKEDIFAKPIVHSSQLDSPALSTEKIEGMACTFIRMSSTDHDDTSLHYYSREKCRCHRLRC